MQYLADQRLPVKVRSLAAQGMQTSPFPEPVVAHMRQLFTTWASDQGYTSAISWDKPAGQPYCLHALTVLSSLLEDRDRCSVGCLRDLMPTFLTSLRPRRVTQQVTTFTSALATGQGPRKTPPSCRSSFSRRWRRDGLKRSRI